MALPSTTALAAAVTCLRIDGDVWETQKKNTLMAVPSRARSSDHQEQAAILSFKETSALGRQLVIDLAAFDVRMLRDPVQAYNVGVTRSRMAICRHLICSMESI
ncbi:hypothetical protein FOZ62_026746, partial [Perkinsus olseni]